MMPVRHASPLPPSAPPHPHTDTVTLCLTSSCRGSGPWAHPHSSYLQGERWSTLSASAHGRAAEQNCRHGEPASEERAQGCPAPSSTQQFQGSWIPDTHTCWWRGPWAHLRWGTQDTSHGRLSSCKGRTAGQEGGRESCGEGLQVQVQCAHDMEPFAKRQREALVPLRLTSAVDAINGVQLLGDALHVCNSGWGAIRLQPARDSRTHRLPERPHGSVHTSSRRVEKAGTPLTIQTAPPWTCRLVISGSAAGWIDSSWQEVWLWLAAKEG